MMRARSLISYLAGSCLIWAVSSSVLQNSKDHNRFAASFLLMYFPLKNLSGR